MAAMTRFAWRRCVAPVAVGAACSVFAVMAMSLSWPTSRESFWFAGLVRVCGLFSIVAGTVTWIRAGRSRLSVLAILAGATYYLQDLRASSTQFVFAVGFCAAYLWTAVFAHLVLAWPDGRVGGTVGRATIVVGYASSVGSQVIRYVVDHRQPPWWYGISSPVTTWTRVGSILQAGTSLTIAAIIVVRWLGASPKQRLAWPMWAVFVVLTTLAAVAGAVAAIPTTLDVQNNIAGFGVAAAMLVLPTNTVHTLLKRQVRDLEGANRRALSKGFETRRLIQRRLHSQVQSPLLAARLELQAAQFAISAGPSSNGTVRELLDRLDIRLSEAQRALAELNRSIYPTTLADHGLKTAVESLADRFRIGVRISVTIRPDHRWDADLEKAIYELISEGLTNSVKHANAEHIEITMEEKRHHLLITLTDDGLTPFESSTHPQAMWDLARTLRAQLKITAGNPRGTIVTITVPKTLPNQPSPMRRP